MHDVTAHKPLKMEAVWSSETLVLTQHYTASQPRWLWRWRQHGPPKLLYLTTTLKSVTPWSSETSASYSSITKRHNPDEYEDGGRIVLRNVCILPECYKTSQPRWVWRWRQHHTPKRLYLTPALQSVTTQTSMKMDAIWSSETLVSYTTLHSVITQMTMKMDAPWSSETSASYPSITKRHNLDEYEDGGRMVLRNVCILPEYYETSQPRWAWRRRQHRTPKRPYRTTTLQSVTTQMGLKMDAVWSSETSVSYHNTRRHHKSDLDLNQHHPEDLHFHTLMPVWSCVPLSS
jgi:hypothetical protein